MTYHEHPLRIMRYSLKNLWLLIFPLLRGVSVLKFDTERLYTWIQGAWMDIAVLGVILIYGLIRWFCSWITLTDDALIHSEGFIVKIRRTIPYSSISSASTENPFYLVPIRAVYVRCDTRAGIFKSADLKIMVTQKAGDDIMSHIPDVKKENSYQGIPRPSVTSVMLFSVFFSSGFSGALYIAMFFFKGGDIAHDLMNIALDRITQQAEHIYMRLMSGIPKALAMTGMLFIGAWILSFIMNLLRYSRFRIDADDNTIKVAFGLIKRRRHRIRSDHINYIDLRQNLIMKLCSAVTVNISCPGYGYDSHLPVLMPISREKNLDKNMWIDIGIPTYRQLKYRPKLTSFFSYTGYPIFGIALVTLFYNYSDIFPVQLNDLTRFIVIMAYIPLAWLTMVKTVALRTSGLSIIDDEVIIRCSKWTSFHTVIVRRNNVVMAQIKQNIFQKLFGKCHLILWLSGESVSGYTVHSLPIKQCKEIISQLS